MSMVTNTGTVLVRYRQVNQIKTSGSPGKCKQYRLRTFQNEWYIDMSIYVNVVYFTMPRKVSDDIVIVNTSVGGCVCCK